MPKQYKSYIRPIIATSLQLQLPVAIGYMISIAISIFYVFNPIPGSPTETFTPLLWGLALSLIAVFVGKHINTKFSTPPQMHLRRGAWIILGVWVIACAISSVVFYASGFPDPQNLENYTVFRRIIDSLYESMSGFTTTGTTILPSVEVFPRGMLFFRTLTHWYGGIGIATLALLLWKKLQVSRSEILNTEAESHLITTFDTDSDVNNDVKSFLKIYVFLTILLFILLTISGKLFRIVPYEYFNQDLFDAANYSLSVMGTGGFGIYNASAGLPIEDHGTITTGGLRDPISEWIITIFMFIAGSKLSLWYVLIFNRSWKKFSRNSELWAYVGFILVVSTIILGILLSYNIYDTFEKTLRYTLFNVATLLSTTGLANTDFTTWPAGAQGLLFLVSLVGGMVGSTAGGLKTKRFMVVYQYIRHELSLLTRGTTGNTFVSAGIRYTYPVASLVLITMLLYYMIFLGGGIAFMAVSNHMVMPDGQVQQIDFTTAFTASIANLGNIGPAVSITSVNTGPTGNYYAFSIPAKIIMIIMMWIGRVGLISLLFLFMNNEGEAKVRGSLAEVQDDV